MPTPKKDGHFLNVYMDRALYEKLQAYCRETGVTKTFAVEEGVRRYLAEQRSGNNYQKHEE